MGKDTSTHVVNFEGNDFEQVDTGIKSQNTQPEKTKSFPKKSRNSRRRRSGKAAKQAQLESVPDQTNDIISSVEEAPPQPAKVEDLPENPEALAKDSSSGEWVDVGVEVKNTETPQVLAPQVLAPQVLAPQAITPILQEAALHQRAKVLGLPDDDFQLEKSIAPTPPPTPQQPFVSNHEDTMGKQYTDFLETSSMPLGSNETENEVMTLHVVPDLKTESLGQKVKSRLVERRNSLEESAHNARLKLDAALVKKFGTQAEKIQTEIEKARISAINDTARIAELLQVQLGMCASDLRDQQQEHMIAADPLLAGGNNPPIEIPENIEPISNGAVVGENVVAQRALEVQEGFEETGHIARQKIDDALERKFGDRAEKVQFEIDRARESALDETAHVAELLQQELGKCASAFRDQLEHGAAPNYH